MKFNGREIEIYSAPITYGIAHFYDNDRSYINNKKERVNGLRSVVLCEVCEKEYLSPTYVYIMSILREANLLPNDYKLLCCKCYCTKYPELVEEEYIKEFEWDRD